MPSSEILHAMEQRARNPDVEEIRQHVIALFDAYLAKDRGTLRSGRTADWKGFQISSTRLVRGVDDYMLALERVLESLRVDRYEFLEFDVDVYGDLALVYYVARDWLASPDKDGNIPTPLSVLIRSLDVYRRVDGSWVQIGSNICSIADPGDA